MGLIIYWILVGLIAGAVARLVVPGHLDIGCIGTILLGIVGSFVGGTLGSILFDEDFDLEAAGLLGSIIGAIIALVIYQGTTGRRGRRRRVL